VLDIQSLLFDEADSHEDAGIFRIHSLFMSHLNSCVFCAIFHLFWDVEL